MRMLWKRCGQIFTLSLVWFALMMPWGSFRDPDAFYHAKMSELLAKQGFIQTFPWLDLTTLGLSFADQHLFLHLLGVPFQHLFGIGNGAQLLALILASMCVVVLFVMLHRLRTPLAYGWTMLFAFSPPMVFRLTIGKASPLAISWFLLGILAVIEGMPWLGFVSGFGFALSHGGWILLLASQIVMMAGMMLSDTIVLEQSLKRVWQRLPWRTIASTWFGVLCAILIHPNRGTLFQLLWVQVVRIGVETPFGRVFLGAEWLPATVKDLLAITAIPCFASLGILFALVKTRAHHVPRERFGAIIGLGVLLACLLALTFKSNRFIEYLVPTWIVFLALLGSYVDWKRAWEFLRMDAQRSRVVYAVLAISIIASFGQNVYQEYTGLRDGASAFHAYDDAGQAIRRITKPWDRVMTSDWDEFPQLFATLDDRRYVSGLDPTFLLDAHPELSDAWREITLGRTTSTAYTFIHDALHAKAVFVTVDEHEAFDATLTNDVRFERVFDRNHVRVYRVIE